MYICRKVSFLLFFFELLYEIHNKYSNIKGYRNEPDICNILVQ